MEYCAFKLSNISYVVPTVMSAQIMANALVKSGSFAYKLSTETLLSYNESLAMSERLFAGNYLQKADKYYEDYGFENFMNYYHGLMLGGLI